MNGNQTDFLTLQFHEGSTFIEHEKVDTEEYMLGKLWKT
jgi:hypothetical protein